MKKWFFLLMAVSLIMASCSSLKGVDPEITNVKKKRAADYSELGSKFLSESDYTKALDFFFLALKQNISIDNNPGIIESYNSIGKTYFAAGDPDSAKLYFGKARDNAIFYRDPLYIAKCLNNLGELALSSENYEEAMELFTSALKEIEKPDKSEVAAIIMHNIGIVHKRNGDFENSEAILREALKINSDLKKYSEMASNYYVISSIYSKNSLYGEALDYSMSALELDKKSENSLGIAKDIYAIGLIYNYLEDYENAYVYFQKSALIYETLGLPEEVIKALINLEETAKKLSLDQEAETWMNTRKALENRNENNETDQQY